MPFAFAPAGVPGSGVLARPYAGSCPSLVRPVAGAWGTGAPIAGSKARFRATGAPIDGLPVTAALATAVSGSAQRDLNAQHDLNAQNDGTTLGFHPSGRSQS
jgi:hypothetical protein